MFGWGWPSESWFCRRIYISITKEIAVYWTEKCAAVARNKNKNKNKNWIGIADVLFGAEEHRCTVDPVDRESVLFETLYNSNRKKKLQKRFCLHIATNMHNSKHCPIQQNQLAKTIWIKRGPLWRGHIMGAGWAGGQFKWLLQLFWLGSGENWASVRQCGAESASQCASSQLSVNNFPEIFVCGPKRVQLPVSKQSLQTCQSFSCTWHTQTSRVPHCMSQKLEFWEQNDTFDGNENVLSDFICPLNLTSFEFSKFWIN